MAMYWYPVDDGVLPLSKDDRICASSLYNKQQLFVGWPGSTPISAAIHSPKSPRFAVGNRITRG